MLNKIQFYAGLLLVPILFTWYLLRQFKYGLINSWYSIKLDIEEHVRHYKGLK